MTWLDEAVKVKPERWIKFMQRCLSVCRSETNSSIWAVWLQPLSLYLELLFIFGASRRILSYCCLVNHLCPSLCLSSLLAVFADPRITSGRWEYSFHGNHSNQPADEIGAMWPWGQTNAHWCHSLPDALQLKTQLHAKFKRKNGNCFEICIKKLSLFLAYFLKVKCPEVLLLVSAEA